MRVGIDARNVTDRASGLVDFVRNLVLELTDRAGVEPVIFCQEKYRTVMAAIPEDHLVFIPFESAFLAPQNAEFERTQFAGIINEQGLAVFHNPFGFGLPNGLACPAVLTVHDLIPILDEDDLQPEQKATYHESLDTSLKSASAVAAISEFTAGELSRLFPKADLSVSVIHDGFDSLRPMVNAERYQELEKKYQLTKPFILYVGSGTKRKNLPNLAKAFAQIADRIPHRLVIVSKFDRPETEQAKTEMLEVAEAAGHRDRFMFTGYLDGADKASLMAAADLFVYPSNYEGFGLPVLEAMSVGTPVICSDIAPFREIAGEAAIFFSQNDPGQIADTMQSALADSATQNRLVEKGRKQSAKFSWKTMASEYADLYTKVAR